ncbi:MAG: cell envelope integrity protein TolA [Saprospiraceae bacterium]
MAKGKNKVVVDITPQEDENSLALVSYVENKKLPETTTSDIISTVGPIFRDIESWKKRVSEIVVTSSEDSEGMKIAGEAGRVILKIRTGLKKQIDEKKLQIKTERIDPIKREYDGWTDMFEFIEGMLKSLETDLRNKRDYAKNLLKKEQDDLRDARKVLAEPYRAFMPPMIDIGLLSQEDFEKALDTAKLAHEGDKTRREKEEKERLEQEEENRKLKVINERINLLSSMNFKFEDGDYIFSGIEIIKVSGSMIKEMSVDDFNTYVESVESKIREIEKEAKEKEEKEEKEAIEKKEKEAREMAEAAEKKRKIIMDRISKIDCAKIEKDGLYLDIPGTTEKEFLIKYDDLYGLSEELVDDYISETNLKTKKKLDDLQTKKDQEEQLRLQRLESAKKAQEEAENKAKAQEEAERKAAMNDKAKLDAIAEEIHDLKKDLVKNYTLSSESGRLIFNKTINDLKEIVDYIDGKIKK